MFKGNFKTAYLQREIAMDIAVAADAPLVVGELVTLTAPSGGTPGYIKSAVSAKAATHIIAQSDMTLEYGHVPVENQDYKYSDKVAATVVSGGPFNSSTPTKKVAVFAITDINDINVVQVG